MFKLVVFSAVLAVAVAKPGVLLSSPLTPLTYGAAYPAVVSPGSTILASQPSSLIYPTSIASPWGYSHFIKKRSPQLPLSYYSPTTYIPTSPIATTYTTTPLLHGAPLVSTSLPVAHYIKKRSAPLLTYSAPASIATPFVASTYAAATPIISSPSLYASSLISQPLAYSTHFIKKRSAPVWSSYITPTSYSHQSRFDLTSTSPVVAYARGSYSSPLVYPGAITTHVL